MASPTTIKPAPLQKGDTIAFISPSARLNTIFPQRISRAKTYFEALGYTIKIIFTHPLPTDHVSLLKARCAEIHTAFQDSSIKAIICTIGGINANELLPHLDYALIKAHPKIFCGYSDITLLHHALYTQSGLCTFYGPAAITQWGECPSPLQFTSDHFFANTTGKSIGAVPRSKEWTQEFIDWSSPSADTTPRVLEPALAWKWLRRGPKAQGRLYGGCLPSLNQLTGSKYLPRDMYKDRILFLETPEGDEIPGSPFAPEMARCHFTDLRNTGILEGICGFVLGRPYRYDEEMREKGWEEMVLEQCYGTEFPILANVDVGHTDPILTLALDALCVLDSEKDEFRILEAGVGGVYNEMVMDGLVDSRV